MWEKEGERVCVGLWEEKERGREGSGRWGGGSKRRKGEKRRGRREGGEEEREKLETIHHNHHELYVQCQVYVINSC